MNRYCRYCGDEFTPDTSHQLFCSEECQQKQKRKPGPNLPHKIFELREHARLIKHCAAPCPKCNGFTNLWRDRTKNYVWLECNSCQWIETTPRLASSPREIL